jgi:hypothetical protein
MRKKPSDYRSGLRFLKKENIPPGGSVFTITDFDEVDKSVVASEHDWRIRLTFDERWWFELTPGNLDAAIELLGDSFDRWIGGRIGLILAEFTTQNGEEKTYIKVVPAPAIELKAPTRLKKRETSDEMFS